MGVLEQSAVLKSSKTTLPVIGLPGRATRFAAVQDEAVAVPLIGPWSPKLTLPVGWKAELRVAVSLMPTVLPTLIPPWGLVATVLTDAGALPTVIGSSVQPLCAGRFCPPGRSP